MIRKFGVKDYKDYCHWLLKRNRPVPSLDELPNEGYICNECVIGFLQDSGKAIVMCNFASKEDEKRSDSVDELIDFFVCIAKERGYRYIMMGTTLPTLIKRLERKGFSVFEENVTHMGMICQPAAQQ